MIKRNRGQTALILILLSAAALIFLAITLNWGRIAQAKSMLTIAADQGASLLASEASSYGEMYKAEYLTDCGGPSNCNETSGIGGFVIAYALLVIAISSFFIPYVGEFIGPILLTIALAFAIANLILQLVVVQPGITKLWDQLQKNQPVQQQFVEQGISTTLQSAVTDQVNITDYFDLNTNGRFGNQSNGIPNDSIGRFAFFYTDRLKMLNERTNPQVEFFYDQLGELMNGETCSQNESDHSLYPDVIQVNPACLSLGGPTCAANPDAACESYCINSPTDAACQSQLPGIFQLNDTCIDSNPSSPTYNPYCDPCCQPLTSGGKTTRPSYCPTDTSASGAPAQCLTNNPYGGSASQYTLLYDPSYQEYANGISFLDQFGRDEPQGPFTNLTLEGNFPNGIYPFFWLMRDYSPQVNNIDPVSNPPSASSPALHWCAAATQAVNGVNIPAFTAPAGFTDLSQLNLTNSTGYSCQGNDCCVDYLADKVSSINSISTPVSDGTTAGTINGVIDMVGSSFSSSPSSNPANSTSFGQTKNSSWIEGDDQLCSTVWPYNGATAVLPDGTCDDSTLDGLDSTMHTLSDFVNFANTFLTRDLGTLSSSINTWYPQVADWIAAPNGRLLTIYDQKSGVDKLNDWNVVITAWLGQTYTNPSAWCLPTDSVLQASSPTEYTYINNPINSGTGPWGDLHHIISCLTYNSSMNGDGTQANFGPVANYQACLSLLTTPSTCPADGSSLAATACDPSVLGRTLLSPSVEPKPGFSGSSRCDPTSTGSYAQWVNDSLTLATDEAPKFAQRAQFLNDIYTRAQTMQTIFTSGDAELKQFFTPCSGTACEDGGPAAQLTYAYNNGVTGRTLPNSVIYGWVDNPPPGSKGGCMGSSGSVGCAHIVKVTAYSPGRGGSGSASAPFVQDQLPNITTWTTAFLRKYALQNRDGNVYVSVKRWDEDHTSALTFPNNHPLWQFLFHNPSTSISTSGEGLMQACNGLSAGGKPIGYGLVPQTVQGLTIPALNFSVANQDQTSLANAFMLNDEGDGKIDPSAGTGTACSAGAGGNPYCKCLSMANILLSYGTESHACARYIGSRNASEVNSNNGDNDYSLKFIDCNSMSNFHDPVTGAPPEDLTYEQQQ